MTVNSVMIVDDSVDDQYLTERSLSRAQLCKSFFFKDNGRDALEFFQNYAENKKDLGDKIPPALVLLDINMPVMNGFEFLAEFEKLRSQNSDLIEVKVVMFSSSDDASDIQRAKSYDFVKDYWVKSVRPQEIVTKFKELFQVAS